MKSEEFALHSSLSILHSSFNISVLIIDLLHSPAHTRQHFVRDGLEHVGEHRHGQVRAEYLDGIALPAVDVGHIDHGHIHTDITDVGRFMAVDDTIAASVTQSAGGVS